MALQNRQFYVLFGLEDQDVIEVDVLARHRGVSCVTIYDPDTEKSRAELIDNNLLCDDETTAWLKLIALCSNATAKMAKGLNRGWNAIKKNEIVGQKSE